MKCPKCGAESSSIIECSVCGIIFEKFEHSKVIEHQHELEEQFESLSSPAIPESVEVWLPLVAAIVGILLLLMLPMIAWMMSMWPHEFGHAFTSWFGGIAATPIPMLGFTSYGGNRSWFVTICFTILMILLGYKSFQAKCYFLLLTFVGMLLAQIYFRFSLSDEDLKTAQAYGGIGGEFWISAWIIMAYHYKFPEKTFWEILRPFFLLAACITFFHNYFLWVSISHGTKEIPWGSLWGGDGDMDFLRYMGNWSDGMITQSYLRLGNICLVIVMIHYGLQVVRSIMQKVK